MDLNINLRKKTVLITGATSGIGAAIADDFMACGAKLILTGADDIETIKNLNEKVQQNGYHQIKYIRVDFTDGTSFKNFFKILDEYEKIDVWINNAGTNRNNPIDKIRLEDFDLLMDVNLRAPLMITKYISKRMKNENYGRIVNIASIWSVKSRFGRTAYTITKAGLVGLTKTSAIELAPYNILVNAVSPGFTLTELTKNTLSEDEFKELKSLVPAKRFAEPREIAKLVLFLASDLNTYITGQNIIIDGGFTNV